MAKKTIQCRLIASSETRQCLWSLAAEKNTPLINELIRGVVNHPEFTTWRIQGRHPAGIVTELCAQFKSDDRFSGQPSRFYVSAEKIVNYIFKSWFTTQSALQPTFRPFNCHNQNKLSLNITSSTLERQNRENVVFYDGFR